MSAERWMKQLKMMEKVRQQVRAKEKTEAAEQEKVRQEAEKRAWMRELEQRDGVSKSLHSYSNNYKEVDKKMDENTKIRIDEYAALLSQVQEQVGDEKALTILQEIKKDERVDRINRERSFNGDAPATEKQIAFLKNLGAVIPGGGFLSRRQASKLIEDTKAAIKEMDKAGKVPVRVP